MDNKNDIRKLPPTQPLSALPTTPEIPATTPPADNPSPKNNRKPLKILGIIALALLGLAGLVLTVWMLFIASFFTAACNPSHTRQEVQAEEAHQKVSFSKLTIVSDQPTRVTATGNNDCIDGGTNSVSVSGSMNLSATYMAVKNDVDANLAKAGYKQIGQVYAHENTHYDAAGRTTFNGLQAGYKNSKGEYVEVTYNFTTVYPYICANGNKICNDPDLQAVQQAPLSGVSFDNNPWPYEDSLSNNRTNN